MLSVSAISNAANVSSVVASVSISISVVESVTSAPLTAVFVPGEARVHVLHATNHFLHHQYGVGVGSSSSRNVLCIRCWRIFEMRLQWYPRLVTKVSVSLSSWWNSVENVLNSDHVWSTAAWRKHLRISDLNILCFDTIRYPMSAIYWGVKGLPANLSTLWRLWNFSIISSA